MDKKQTEAQLEIVFGIITHELLNPLTIVVGRLDTASSPDANQAFSSIEKAKVAVTRTVSITRKLRSLHSNEHFINLMSKDSSQEEFETFLKPFLKEVS